MNEFTIEIRCPDIIRAAEIIAEAIRGGAAPAVKSARHRTSFGKNDVNAMNAMILSGKSVKEIAGVFGCHYSTVSNRKRKLLDEVGV